VRVHEVDDSERETLAFLEALLAADTLLPELVATQSSSPTMKRRE